MDDYCIALLVLVLFCLYVDNQNKTEGYSDYGSIKEEHIKLGDNYGSHSNGAPKPLIQDYKPVGATPQKTTMPAPPSMVPSLHALAPANMNDYMLLHDAVDGYDVMGADLPVAYPRVGAPDNLGRDTLFHDDDDDDEPMHQPYEADNLHATLDDGGDEDYLTVDQQIRHHETGTILPGGGGGGQGGQPSKQLEVHMVYAEWCGHSKNAQPDFETIKQNFDNTNQNGHNVKVISSDVDTPEGKKMAEKFDVKGFPTHIITDGTNVLDASAPRDADGLAAAIKKHTSN